MFLGGKSGIWLSMCGMVGALALVLGIAVSGLSCGSTPPPSEPPGLDAQVFRDEIYPVLLRDCGFPACHASSQPGLEEANNLDNGRSTASLRVTGPGRARLNPETPLRGEFLDEEIDDAFERSRSLVFPGADCEASPFLRKPLEVDSGGASHRGNGVHGRDIYARTDDPSYVLLRDWACTQTGVATNPVDTGDDGTEEDNGTEEDDGTDMVDNGEGT